MLTHSLTACFTGHRPQKLPWGNNENDERCIAMKISLKRTIENSIRGGYDTFICGMALGFDMICAETVLELKENYTNIKLIGALPCRNQDIKWTDQNKLRYRKLLSRLDGIRCIYEYYVGAQCMKERNRYMVDNSSLLIALCNGVRGGTEQTIEYARKKGLDIIVLEY